MIIAGIGKRWIDHLAHDFLFDNGEAVDSLMVNSLL